MEVIALSSCLIVVDYQNDFVDGALGFDGASAIESRIKNHIQAMREKGGDILFTLDTHDDSYLESEEGKHLPVEHCIKGTQGHQLREEIAALKTEKDKVFEKTTFPSLAMANHLKAQKYDQIFLVGLVSNICVISNAVMAKSACPNAEIIVDASATASYDYTLHEKALDVMEGLHIIIKNRG